jgi:ribosome-binding factor A
MKQSFLLCCTALPIALAWAPHHWHQQQQQQQHHHHFASSPRRAGGGGGAAGAAARGAVAMMARGSSLTGGGKESKRQARVSQVMRAELADIVRRGDLKSAKALPDTLRQKISVVDINMSPDLRSAKVFVSVFGESVEKRQAYAWLVEHSKHFKYSLAQRLSSMKSVPDVYFKETDISAAVDVMVTIDRLSEERRSRGHVDGHGGEDRPSGMIDGLDFDFLDELVEDDEDEDEDEGFEEEEEVDEEDIEEYGDYDEERDGDFGKWQ